jgi:nucleotide-binding universal stress UspA family protein
MMNLQRILHPTDFSEHASHALHYALELSDRFDAELHLLHVLEVHVSSTPQFGMGLALPSNFHESEEAAERALDKLLDPDWAASHRVVPATRQGNAFVEVIRYARDQEIDVIVLSTHGRTGLSHILMGSVAERVVRKSPCPVLTVRPEGHQFVMP